MSKMSLFLVEYKNNYDAFEFCGVFSTEEKAKEYIAKFDRSEQPYFYIDEVTVDEP